MQRMRTIKSWLDVRQVRGDLGASEKKELGAVGPFQMEKEGSMSSNMIDYVIMAG